MKPLAGNKKLCKKRPTCAVCMCVCTHVRTHTLYMYNTQKQDQRLQQIRTPQEMYLTESPFWEEVSQHTGYLPSVWAVLAQSCEPFPALLPLQGAGPCDPHC